MKAHHHYRDTGIVRHFWPGDGLVLTLELDVEDIALLQNALAEDPGASRILIVGAVPAVPTEEIEAGLSKIEGGRPPEKCRRLVRIGDGGSGR